MKKIILAVAAIAALNGCALQPIGKEDFTCKNLKKGGVCAGTRDIYELTNDRESLENLSLEDLEAQVTGNVAKPVIDGGFDVKSTSTVYEPRNNNQHSTDSYQGAKVIPQTRFDNNPRDGFEAWPNNGEPLAPEALAVMTEPKAMRVLVTAWKDTNGFLNLPGYIYVDVQPKTWKYGEAANLRPTRVVPLQMRQESQETMRELKHKSSGVSPLEVITGSK